MRNTRRRRCLILQKSVCLIFRTNATTFFPHRPIFACLQHCLEACFKTKRRHQRSYSAEEWKGIRFCWIRQAADPCSSITGTGGLTTGAVESGYVKQRVEVEDEGVLYDMDTPRLWTNMKKLHKKLSLSASSGSHRKI